MISVGFDMKRIVKILFLVIFSLNGVSQGGAVVRYPMLEQALEKIDREYPSQIANQIRGHSSPFAMCGVKATVGLDNNFLSGLRQFSSVDPSLVTSFEVFALLVIPNVVSLHLQNQLSSQFVSIPVFLPPPQLSI